jgi:single-strand DNA-binding protein
MINGATVTLAGYVATEPHYRTINDTTPVVSMRVAWTSRFIDRETGEWRDGKTSFANVKCWRKLANNVAPSLRKGQAIVLTGRLQVRDYDDREGRRRVAVDIDADAIGHDLSRGVAHFQRTLRSAGEAAADGQQDGLAMGEAIRAGLADEDVTAADDGVVGVAGADDGVVGAEEDVGGAEEDVGGAEEDVAGVEGPGLSSAGPVPGEKTGPPDDMFNADAIDELAGAAGSATADGATAAAVPF